MFAVLFVKLLKVAGEVRKLLKAAGEVRNNNNNFQELLHAFSSTVN